MKYRILVALASLVLAALILLLLPLDAPIMQQPSTTIPAQSSTPSSTTTVPPTLPPKDPGVVRLYSCDDRFLSAFSQFAAEYTALTGVEVVVLRPDADGCQATLQRYMESEDPPTMLCIHNQRQLLIWQDTLLDLEDTPLASTLCNDGLGMRLDGKLLGVPAEVAGYGLLVNAELLAHKAALTRDGDFGSFSALTTAVQILKNNSVKAFPSPTLTLRDAWHLLLADDQQNVRAFLDLAAANCNKSGDPMTLFLNGKSAFYLGGSWEYDTLAAFTDSTLDVMHLDILPNYAAGAMQYICNTIWCLNASARQVDIDATMDFMVWMVTARENSPAPVDRLEVLSPFADAAWYGNRLENKLRTYMRTETAVLQFDGGEMGAEPLLTALSAYIAQRNNETWQQLCQTVETIKASYGYHS